MLSNNESVVKQHGTPIDARDPQDQVVTANGAVALDHILTDKSIAIQKSVAILSTTPA